MAKVYLVGAGPGDEEAEALAVNNIPYEIAPDITSGVAASAYALRNRLSWYEDILIKNAQSEALSL